MFFIYSLSRVPSSLSAASLLFLTPCRFCSAPSPVPRRLPPVLHPPTLTSHLMLPVLSSILGPRSPIHIGYSMRSVPYSLFPSMSLIPYPLVCPPSPCLSPILYLVFPVPCPLYFPLSPALSHDPCMSPGSHPLWRIASPVPSPPPIAISIPPCKIEVRNQERCRRMRDERQWESWEQCRTQCQAVLDLALNRCGGVRLCVCFSLVSVSHGYVCAVVPVVCTCVCASGCVSLCLVSTPLRAYHLSLLVFLLPPLLSWLREHFFVYRTLPRLAYIYLAWPRLARDPRVNQLRVADKQEEIADRIASTASEQASQVYCCVSVVHKGL